MLDDFKAFVVRGNVVDLAVGIVMGASFGAIVPSLVNDILIPPIGRLLGRVDFTNFFVSLSGQSYPTLAAARAAGVPTLNYGVFLNTVINFLIVSFAMFVVIRQVNRLYSKPASAGAGTKGGLYFPTTIPHPAPPRPPCTSDLASAR